MIVKLTEVIKNSSGVAKSPGDNRTYSLREVYVNPEHVVCVREDIRHLQLLKAGALPEELDENHKFSHVIMQRGQSGIDLIVVGEPKYIEKKLRSGVNLLNG
tara:strand:- start:15489 stop:15794 length:306 start_codon:yes stop_codon:yes gene_type:complete